METLDKLDITEETIVIFFSDNGGHGPTTSMLPLRGSKGMLYEGGIRVPMIVSLPGKIKANTTCNTPVIGTDFYPTLLEMTKTEKPKDYHLDGESIVPLLNQKGDLKRDSIYFHFPAYLQSYKKGSGPWRTTPCGAIRKGDYKLIEFFEDGTIELYNIKDDISESNDLAKKLPDKTKELYADLVKWRKAVNAPVPTEKNPMYVPTGKKGRGNKKTS
jgi:arylsulfatase A-like enzyme